MSAKGIVSSLHRDNAKAACRVQCTSAPPWLFDPQTSGGLLAAVKPDKVTRTLEALHAAGFSRAVVIGEVVPIEAGSGPTIYL